MKNLIFTIILILLAFFMLYSALLCADKQAELNCINSLEIDEDVSICKGE